MRSVTGALRADGSDIGSTGYRTQDRVAASPLLRAGGLPKGLNRTGSLLLETIREREDVSLDELADALVQTCGRPRPDALTDVALFVQRAQVAGLLSYETSRRVLPAGVRLAAQVALVPVRGGLSLPSVQRRQEPFSVGRMVSSTISAQLRLGVVVTLVALVPLSLIGGFWSRAGLDVVAGLALGIIGGLALLGVVHECAHAALSIRWRSRPHSVYRQGLRVGLQRPRLGPGKDLMVAACGPAAGTAAGCLLVAVVFAVDAAGPTGLTRALILGTCIATALQVACLVPPAADGRVVVACLTALRHGRGRPAGEAP